MSTTTAVRKVPAGSPAPRTGSYKPPSISKGSKVSATNGNSSPATAPSKDAKKGATKETSPSSKTASSGAPFSAKQAAVKRVNTSDISDLELENAAAMDDLRTKLAASEEKAESAANDFANQVKALQLRLDEAVSEQSKLEESLHARDNTIEGLQNEVKDLSRNKKEQEKILDSEREAFINEKEEMVEKEQALNTIVMQLKKALSHKDKPEDAPLSPSGTTASEQVDSALLDLKEKLVDTLRLELAEAQIRLTEAEQLGGAKLREAEEKLLEARMANARLTEDNESFQLLLGQATMNGDFAKGEFLSNYMDSTPSSPTPSKMGHSPKNSLAGELEAAVGKDAEDYKKLESEVKSLKDQNKALTLYINKIIGRLLQSGMESILDKTPDTERERERNKELPPTPEERDSENMPPPMMLGRTRSLAQRKPMNIKPLPIATPGGDNARPLQRSVSTSSRGHRRSHSDAPYSPPAGKNDPQNQPGSRQTVFYTGNPLQRMGTFPMTPSATTTGTTSSSNSFTSNENGDIITPTNTTPSPPHTASGPISGKTLRPLTLLGQGPPAMKSPSVMSPRKASGGSDMMDDDVSKKSKRTSWIGGWFNKGGKDDELPSVAEDSIASKLNAQE